MLAGGTSLVNFTAFFVSLRSVIRENPASRGTETSAEVLVGSLFLLRESFERRVRYGPA